MFLKEVCLQNWLQWLIKHYPVMQRARSKLVFWLVREITVRYQIKS